MPSIKENNSLKQQQDSLTSAPHRPPGSVGVLSSSVTLYVMVYSCCTFLCYARLFKGSLLVVINLFKVRHIQHNLMHSGLFVLNNS